MSSGGFKFPSSSRKGSSHKRSVKKHSQTSLTSFFGSGVVKKTKLVTTDLIGGGVKIECPYCFKYFSTQGYPNHEKQHKSLGHKMGTKPQVGKAKTRGDKYTKPVIHCTKQPTVDLTKEPTTTTSSVTDLSSNTGPDPVATPVSAAVPPVVVKGKARNLNNKVIISESYGTMIQ